MVHREYHPRTVDGCMGCKVLGIGYDGGHTTQSQIDENRATITQYRDGRQDVTVRPKPIRYRLGRVEA